MPLPLPAYCLHKPTGRAYVTVRVNGKRRPIYLGTYDSPESRQRYAEVIAGLKESPPAPPATPTSPPPTPPRADLLVADAYALWIAHCRVYYRLPDGSPSREQDHHRLAWVNLLALFAGRGLLSLSRRDWVAVREAMIARGLSRKSLNQHWGRVYHALKWTVEQGLVEDRVLFTAKLTPLPAFRSAAPERSPVGPVPLEDVRATQGELEQPVRTMVELMLLTGMRPGEVCALKGSDLIWDSGVCGRGMPSALLLAYHKMVRKGRRRHIPLSRSAAELLLPYALAAENAQVVLFPPTAPLQGANRRRRGRYDRTTFARVITRAAERAGVAHWSPNQVRHLTATLTRKLLDLDAARALLGHDDVKTTTIYAERDEEAARRAAEAIEKALKEEPPPAGEAKGPG
ncbi:tyrosine-type recombinase/integrase [Limnoglobus roseus]|uniref:Site-specific integrase n=1 Tax=Limnoglobus roseus TaxID=2598579 RepID=A0A5C1ASG9_9BACT|nr:site-specific integrase [Limnoglobus roseus]QEL19848.1 site-specific integrase [Limnoglobus roseus]